MRKLRSSPPIRLSKFGIVAALLAFGSTGSVAYAGSVTTIWGDSPIATFMGTGILQEWDLSGNLLDTITAPHGIGGRGVAQVGDILYYTSSGTNEVYAYNFKTNTDLGTVFTVSKATTGLATIAYDGSHFFIGDYDGFGEDISGTNKVYEYTLTGTLLNTISLSQCSGNCDGLEYVNGNLVSNEFDGGLGEANTYDVYSLSGTLLQPALITGHDISGNTGIAFDGTDYYVSNIYAQTISVYDASGNYLHDFTLQTGGYPTLVEDLSVNYTAVLPTPLPAAFPLFAAAVAGIGVVGRLRKRRGSAAVA